ncbi:MAG: response regulator [Anaerolineales bacterium]
MPQKILIIDDDIDTLKLVGIMLERKGFEILASTKGEKGLEMAKSELPDLVLLDIMIPDLDGYEIARELRSNPETEAIPIIMFTAKSQVDDKVEGLEAGADAYITKPARPRELFAQVSSILKRVPQRAKQTQTASDGDGILIGVIGAKGGLGLSTLATNLAIELNEQTEKNVVLSDFRPGQGTICLDLDMTNTEGFKRLLEMDRDVLLPSKVKDSLLIHQSGLKTLLSSYHPSDASYITEDKQFLAVAQNLKKIGDYAVIDLGPSLPPISNKVLPECSKIIVCMEPSPENITHTKALIENLSNHGIGEGRLVTVLINRQRSGVQLSWEQSEELFGRNIDQIFTPVPELAYQAARSKIPMVKRSPDSMTAEQFTELASKLTE